MRCVVGRAVSAEEKREGDGCTPAGLWPSRRVLYRADRFDAPEHLNASREPNDAPNYNRHVKLPYSASCKSLCRDDHLYDCIIVLGFNDDPPMPGKGSAIFVRIAAANDGSMKTTGCVAVAKEDVHAFLNAVKMSVGDFIRIS